MDANAKRKFTLALKAYWKGLVLDAVNSVIGTSEKGESGSSARAIDRLCELMDQDGPKFGFREWYLVHRVFPMDVEVYKKLFETMRMPHERLYTIAVSVACTDRFFDGLSDDQKKLLSASLRLEIEKFREDFPDDVSGDEYGKLYRLVAGSSLSRKIYMLATAWLFPKHRDTKELHRYPVS